MRVYAILAAAVTLTACATITKGTNQTVAIDTPGAPGAICTAQMANGPQQVQTPGAFILAKGSAAVPVRCIKECFQEAGGLIGSSLEAMTAGNILIGGVVGIGVDAVSGAINKYPDAVNIPMTPIPGCGLPPPTRRKK